MLTEKDYCDYETSVALKELGYIGTQGECCYFGAYYQNGNDIFYDRLCNPELGEDEYLRVPLYLAQKFLREEKEVYVTVIPEYNEFGPIKGVKYRLEVAYWKDDEFGYETIEWLDEECPHTIITFDSYEEALSEGIKEAVKILTNKENE